MRPTASAAARPAGPPPTTATSNVSMGPRAYRRAAARAAGLDATRPRAGAWGVRPVDRALGLYFALAPLALLLHPRPAAWPALALAHWLAAAVLLRLPAPQRAP